MLAMTGCANYGTGPGGAITGADAGRCGIGAVIGLVLANQITDIRRSSNEKEWKIAAAMAGCAAAPWVNRKFNEAVARGVQRSAVTHSTQDIVWDGDDGRRYRAVAQPVQSGYDRRTGRSCEQIRVAGMRGSPRDFTDRLMTVCETRSGSYEIVDMR